MNRANELVWLAGLLEGEGCFQLVKASRYSKAARISLMMKDRDVLERAANVMGAKTWKQDVRPSKLRPSWATYYRTAISGRKAIRLMMVLYPLLGDRRREKIAEVYLGWRLNPHHGRIQHGRVATLA